MTDKPRRAELAGQINPDDVDFDGEKMLYKCESCGHMSATLADGICPNCQGKMAEIVERGGTVEEYK